MKRYWYTMLAFALGILPNWLVPLTFENFGGCMPSVVERVVYALPALGVLVGFAMVVIALANALVRRKPWKKEALALIVYLLALFVAGIVLASFSTARSNGSNAAIMSNLSVIQTETEVRSHDVISYPPTQSCDASQSIFSSAVIQNSIASIRNLHRNVTCIASKDAWAVAAEQVGGSPYGRLCREWKAEDVLQWCVDSLGAAQGIRGPLTAPVCPEAYTPPPNGSGGVFDVHTVDCLPKAVYDLDVKNGMIGSSIGICPD